MQTKFKKFLKIHEKLNNESSTIKGNSYNNISNLFLLKYIFGSKYKEITHDSSQIIEVVSANNQKKINIDITRHRHRK